MRRDRFTAASWQSLENLWATGFPAAVQAAAQAGQPIFFTGHSKGGSLASLAAVRFKSMGIVPAGVITFGAPCTGDETFASAYNGEVPNHWRFEHRNDVVPHLPPGPMLLSTLSLVSVLKDLLHEKITGPIGYYEQVGQLCFLDWNNQLEQTFSSLLRYQRDLRLITAGEQLITDHYLDASASTGGLTGYIQVINQLPLPT